MPKLTKLAGKIWLGGFSPDKLGQKMSIINGVIKKHAFFGLNLLSITEATKIGTKTDVYSLESQI